ncbi:hemolysin-type calcium-binding region [Nostoc linckia NIES-25]|nr:hemolysin-type calcium-binding region [Nostoc linckia NIES-25]
MPNNLGFIDKENNNLAELAVNLGSLKGTNTGAGVLTNLTSNASTNDIDWYSFKLDSTAPLNSYIELSSPDVVNIKATYNVVLFKYNLATDSYDDVTSYQLPNYPYTERIDLTSLPIGTYYFAVVGAAYYGSTATGLYNLRISIPSPSLPGTAINGTDISEKLTGGNEENTINGKAGNDTLIGGAGDDTLNGGDGNDILTGGADSDLLNGGAGTDKVVESGDLAKFILTNDRLIANGVDVLISVEQAVLTGGSSWNTLDASGFTLGSVTLDGGASDDSLFGGSKSDRLIGGDGYDYLDGKAGLDTLIGGAGGDTYVVDNVGDVISETASYDYDRVLSSVTYTLGTNLEELTLTGTAAINGTGNSLDNRITGNTGNNTLNGGVGDDTLDGKGGVDTLIGGSGSDSYKVDNTLDVIIETSTTDSDRVEASATYTLAANLENLTLVGSGGNINGTGNSLDNQISGDSANNILSGLAGADLIYGQNGNDTLNGGDGNDYLYAGAGDDVINGGNGDDYLDSITGKDIFNGGAGKDYFADDLDNNNIYVFQFGQSSASGADVIGGYSIGSDKIDLLAANGTALGKPVSLTRAADNNYYGTELDLVKQVFIDANGKLAGNQALGINSAAIVYNGLDLFLVVNDGIAGFQASSDLSIRLETYGTLPGFGSVPVDTFFV